MGFDSIHSGLVLHPTAVQTATLRFQWSASQASMACVPGGPDVGSARGGSSSPRTGTRRTACDLHSLAGAMALEHPSVEGGSVLGVSKVHPEASKKVLHSLFSRCSAAQGRVRSSRQKLEFTHPSRSPFTPEKPLGGDVANLLR